MQTENFKAIMEMFHKNKPLNLAQRQVLSKLIDSDNEHEITTLQATNDDRFDSEMQETRLNTAKKP